MKKRICAIVLVAYSFIAVCCTSAFASSQTSTGSATMDAYIINMFESAGYQVLKNGTEDITDTFYAETMSAYLAGDLQAIIDYMFANQISVLSPDTYTYSSSLKARERYQVVQCHKGGVELVDELLHGIKNHNYIIWDLYSNITYDSNEGFITHASSPTITIDLYMHYGDDPGWSTLDYATKSVHDTYVYFTFGGDVGLHVIDVGDIGVVNLTYQYRFDYDTTYYLPI